MRADTQAQHALLAVADLDTQLRQHEHRLRKLPEAERLAAAKTSARSLADEAAVVAMRVEDLDREIARLEGDVNAVRQREERDEQLLRSGTLDSRVQSDVQHELGSLRRRQGSLEDELIELMGSREEEQATLAGTEQRRSSADAELTAAEAAFISAQAQVKEQVVGLEADRATRAATVPAELLARYERLRAQQGVAAARLTGRRCEACRLELNAVELSRLNAADPSEVVSCPECEAILIRTGSR